MPTAKLSTLEKQRIDELWEVLKDGEYHHKLELVERSSCPNVPMLNYTMMLYRRQLPADEMVVCELHRRNVGYRHVKRLVKPNTKG